jgi:hypothetical protein
MGGAELTGQEKLLLCRLSFRRAITNIADGGRKSATLHASVNSNGWATAGMISGARKDATC